MQENKKQLSMASDNSQNIQPEQVVIQLIEAMSVNDAAKIRSLFHKDAKQAYGESGSWKSGEAFFKWLQSDIIDRKGQVDTAKFSADGDKVVVTGQYSSVGYTNKANFLFSVENGKIKSWQMRY
ncbi:nuclear transport factor 2 family protein [uncultured Kriegella sp.]|uniref:nuclear transport factor 2 family protein n=1 Tax=uncultured Kriegella sp. TaxID=1798910 RepID=UPI0030DA79D7|tara:strand:+ start:2102 stop:2473 length:372 start_codon:yes stop_codon:yes gene_type:complete